jgi:TatD DNase family protein
MLVDTHCHLDAAEFDADRDAVIAAATAAGVCAIVIPATSVANFSTVRDVAHRFKGGYYGLGIHPLFIEQAQPADLITLRARIAESMDDPRFVAIGEIGLDFFVTELGSGALRAKQEHFYRAQLEMALAFNLPVLLHVRRAQDIILKHLRRLPRLVGGIAHAFNGSTQQAQALIERGLALGLGATMTYPRSLQIRRHAANVSLDSLVLETDAPGSPPVWLHTPDRRNVPAHMQGIAQALAELRGTLIETVAQATGQTAQRVLPRLAAELGQS